MFNRQLTQKWGIKDSGPDKFWKGNFLFLLVSNAKQVDHGFEIPHFIMSPQISLLQESGIWIIKQLTKKGSEIQKEPNYCTNLLLEAQISEVSELQRISGKQSCVGSVSGPLGK